MHVTDADVANKLHVLNVDHLEGTVSLVSTITSTAIADVNGF